MAKPVIVFVPGSYVLLSAYKSFLDGLSNAGYEVQGIHPPTIGPSSRQGGSGPAPSMHDDASVIAKAAEKLADEGKDVILMGHSYAGIPMSQSTRGLSKSERTAQRKSGGIVRLAFISALVPPLGSSAGSLLGRFPAENRPAVSVDDNGWMLMEDPAATAAMICQDLPDKEGQALVRSFAKHSAQSFGNELTHAGYATVPSSYLLCEEDAAGPAPFQREMIATIEKASGQKVDVTSIQSGHCPTMSKEKETVEWALKVAETAIANSA